MTSLRASYPVLKDRFSSFTRVPFGQSRTYNRPGRIMEANGYLFATDEQFLYVSRDGISFLKIASTSFSKISDVAYGGGKYVFVGEGIWTSDGPDANFLWTLTEQTPDEVGYNFYAATCVHFDGTAFVAGGQIDPDVPAPKPVFQRALPADLTTWTAIEGATVAVPDVTVEDPLIMNIKSHGGRMVAVGYYEGETLTDGGAGDVIQYSDDNGLTWTNVLPPAPVFQVDAPTGGLSELVVTNDGRWMALSSDEAESLDYVGAVPRFIQSEDGAVWESIFGRLVTPHYYKSEEAVEVEHRSALFIDGGQLFVLLPGMEAQIGRLGATGPTSFERVQFPGGIREPEQGMGQYKGNYYMTVEPIYSEEVAYFIAFTPRLPVEITE
jgi:hypothetical protein